MPKLPGLSTTQKHIFSSCQQDAERARHRFDIGRLLTSSFDHRISPCTDFYRHTCGNYRKVLLDIGEGNVWDMVNREHTYLLLDGLTDRQALKTSNSKAVRYVLDLYDQCLSETRSTSKCQYLYNDEKFSEHLTAPLSRIYLDQLIAKKGLDKVKKIRQRGLDLMVHLRAAVKDLLIHSDWLDEPTRQAALDKMVAMRQLVGYDDDLLDDAKLDFGLSMNSAPALGANHSDSYEKWRLHYEKVSNATISWIHLNLLPTHLANGAYILQLNTVVVTMTMLQEPFLELDDPEALQYGFLGFILSHEIFHGFDNDGATFDKNGQKHNWWSTESKRGFEERTGCLVEQYSSITEPVTRQRLNGTLTLGENIADNGGIRSAYLAFEKHTEWHDTRGGFLAKEEFQHYTPKQLFFYAYAMGWCEAFDKKVLREALADDAHSLEKYRVNVVLQNFEPFAETFSCPQGSAMNPQHKCRVW